jgi:hypothetical protein
MTIGWALLIVAILVLLFLASKETRKKVGKIAAWLVAGGAVLGGAAGLILFAVNHRKDAAEHEWWWNHYTGYRLEPDKDEPQDRGIYRDLKKLGWARRIARVIGVENGEPAPDPDPWQDVSEKTPPAPRPVIEIYGGETLRIKVPPGAPAKLAQGVPLVYLGHHQRFMFVCGDFSEPGTIATPDKNGEILCQ